MYIQNLNKVNMLTVDCFSIEVKKICHLYFNRFERRLRYIRVQVSSTF